VSAAAPPKYGITVSAHVACTMDDAELSMASVFERLRDGKRLTRIDREVLAQRLAGVVGGVETIRIWLASGAPK
jgi:hypothetical protein